MGNRREGGSCGKPRSIYAKARGAYLQALSALRGEKARRFAGVLRSSSSREGLVWSRELGDCAAIALMGSASGQQFERRIAAAFLVAELAVADGRHLSAIEAITNFDPNEGAVGHAHERAPVALRSEQAD